MTIKYEVILKVGYHEACFLFERSIDAVSFAESCLLHMVDCEDTKAKKSIILKVRNGEEQEDDE